MKNRPRILLLISAPLIIGGMAVMIAGWSAFPFTTILFPLGMFLLGAAIVDYLTRKEFRRMDDQLNPEGGSPGDHLQHIIAPQQDRHEKSKG